MGNDDDVPDIDEFEDDREVGGGLSDTPTLFLGGIVVGAALLGLVWIIVSSLSGDSLNADDQPSRSHIVQPLLGSEPAVTPREAPTRMERCATAAADLSAPLGAARPALDQWAVHVGAMNKLVVGAISLRQANAFWNQTRVGAHHRIAGFRAAEKRLNHRGLDCPSPAMLPAKASPALRSCSRRVAADLRTLDAARTAISTWATHVHHMEMLRMGMMSPSRATRMWLSMWQQGVHELRTYRADARETRNIKGCATKPSTGELPSQQGELPDMDMDMGS